MTDRRRVARILATLIDLACMLPWIAVVAAAGVVLWMSGVTHSVDDVLGNLVGLITLIVPITLAAAGFEGSSRNATPGKRVLRLQVFVLPRSAGVDANGPTLGFGKALLRNAVKYALPWELGHTAVFALVGSTSVPPPWVMVVLIAAYAVPLGSLVLLLVTGRALHDLIAGTRVGAAS